MTITSVSEIAAAMGASTARHAPINKANITTQLAGGYSSLWRGTGTPAQGAIPGAAAVCTKSLTGSLIDFTNPTPPVATYLGKSVLNSLATGVSVMVLDRLAHMGGLSGTVTTAQTVGVDVSGSGDNLPARIGATDYSEVQWWVEIYTDIGTTGVTATITYTNAANTGGQSTTVTLGGASPANQDSRFFPISFPAGGCRSIQSIQHVTTGTAGSYGITATRYVTEVALAVASTPILNDWADLGLPRVHDSACLMLAVVCGGTSTGQLSGSFKVIQG